MNHDKFEIRVTVPATMSAGRGTLSEGLAGWGCGNVDDVVLVFSELVTNAAVHTLAPSRTVITHVPPNVRIGVHDRSFVLPDADADGAGFGLRIVSQLSDSWGWEQTPTGKVVWSIIPCGH